MVFQKFTSSFAQGRQSYQPTPSGLVSCLVKSRPIVPLQSQIYTTHDKSSPRGNLKKNLQSIIIKCCPVHMAMPCLAISAISPLGRQILQRKMILSISSQKEIASVKHRHDLNISHKTLIPSVLIYNRWHLHTLFRVSLLSPIISWVFNHPLKWKSSSLKKRHKSWFGKHFFKRFSV